MTRLGRLVTSSAAAARLGVSRTLVEDWCRTGAVSAVTVGAAVYLTEGDVRRLEADRTMAAQVQP